MKLILIICSFLFPVLSGKLSVQKNALNKSGLLTGKWTLISCSGGFTGKGPGWDLSQKIEFEFTRSGKFCRKENGEIKASDKFKLKTSPSIFGTEAASIVDFKKLTDLEYRRSGDTLVMRENVHDGFEFVLLKKSKFS